MGAGGYRHDILELVTRSAAIRWPGVSRLGRLGDPVADGSGLAAALPCPRRRPGADRRQRRCRRYSTPATGPRVQPRPASTAADYLFRVAGTGAYSVTWPFPANGGRRPLSGVRALDEWSQSRLECQLPGHELGRFDRRHGERAAERWQLAAAGNLRLPAESETGRLAVRQGRRYGRRRRHPLGEPGGGSAGDARGCACTSRPDRRSDGRENLAARRPHLPPDTLPDRRGCVLGLLSKTRRRSRIRLSGLAHLRPLRHEGADLPAPGAAGAARRRRSAPESAGRRADALHPPQRQRRAGARSRADRGRAAT